MNYTEKQCTDILQKVIDDLNELRESKIFYDTKSPFEAIFQEKSKNLYTNEIIERAWLAYAKVPKDGWKGGNIIITIDDDTGKATTYSNHALGGRPITLPLEINENGKYFIPIEFE